MKTLKNAYYFTVGYNKEDKIYFSKTLVLTDLSILKQLLQYKKKIIWKNIGLFDLLQKRRIENGKSSKGVVNPAYS